METVTLAKNIENYYGQYVATKSFTDKDVISHGLDPVKVYNEAKETGAMNPFIFFVPDKDVVQIYFHADN